MRINNIQNFNQKSNLNFSALRLKAGSEKYISSMPKKALLYVDDAGEYLRDTKFYHVDIADNVSISCINGDKYYYPHNIQQNGKSIILRAKGGYSQISKRIEFDTVEKAVQASKFISESETTLIKASRIAKYLDEQELKKIENLEEKISPTDNHEEIVKKLLKKYKV